jgi:enterochelin esterase-like enzyme
MKAKDLLFALLTGCLLLTNNAQAQVPSSGSLRCYAGFPSSYVPARTVEVWLPDGYDSTQRYAVLYMHDGRMLFDSATTWNRQEWRVDETAGALIAAKKTRPFIVVGIWNSGPERHAEYCPQKPFSLLSPADSARMAGALRQDGKPFFAVPVRSDRYLEFLVKELKPFIDKTFSTYTDRNNTFIAGASMGGLISLYAICEYPETFGGAACLSTHWPVIYSNENNPLPDALMRYMKKKLPKAGIHRVYFDYGTETLDSLYAPGQRKADKCMRAAGYGPSDWITLKFAGDDHSEKSWSKRLAQPLVFLLGRN